MGAKGIDTLVGAGTVAQRTAEAPVRRPQLLGTDERTLDDRGRLSIPTRYRWAFEDGVAIIPWPGPCIALVPTAQFLKIERKMRTKQRELLGDELARDALTELATHTYLDGQGRLFLDAAVRDDSGIGTELVLVGRIRRLELWAPGSRDEGRDARRQALHAHIAAEAL